MGKENRPENLISTTGPNRGYWGDLIPTTEGSRFDHMVQKGSLGPTKHSLSDHRRISFRPYDPGWVIGPTKTFYDRITLRDDAISSQSACNRIEPTWKTLLQLLISPTLPPSAPGATGSLTGRRWSLTEDAHGILPPRGPYWVRLEMLHARPFFFGFLEERVTT